MGVFSKTSLKVHKRNLYYQLEFMLDLLDIISTSEEAYEVPKVVAEIKKIRLYRKELDAVKTKEIDLQTFTFHSKINNSI